MRVADVSKERVTAPKTDGDMWTLSRRDHVAYELQDRFNLRISPGVVVRCDSLAGCSILSSSVRSTGFYRCLDEVAKAAGDALVDYFKPGKSWTEIYDPDQIPAGDREFASSKLREWVEAI